MNPYFSILVPACNMEGKMTQCIDSLHAQTFGDYEVIIVDDGSKDGTWEELQGYEREDARFHALRHEVNRSLLAARYTAMRQAKGAYILFLDSDDYLEADTLESLHAYIAQNPVDVVRFGFVYEPSKAEVLPIETDDPITAFMTGKITPAIWKNCYSLKTVKRLLERTSDFYCNMGEDVYFATVLFSCADSFGRVSRIFHHYVTGAGMSNTQSAMSREKMERDWKSVMESGTHLLRFIREYNPSCTEMAEKAVRSMYRFVVLSCLGFLSDNVEIVDRVRFFDRPESREVYEWACRYGLPFVMISKAEKDDETFKDCPKPDFYKYFMAD